MNRRLSLLFLGIFLIFATACASPNASGVPSPAPSTPSPPTPMSSTAAPARASSETGRFFAINEVGLGQDGYVALTNYTDVPANLDGLYLCNGSQCVALPDVVVPAGETARVAVGDVSGIEGIVVDGAGLGPLRSADGEIALYASQELDDPGAMLLYYQWGSNPHELTQTAVDAGLWVVGGYGPSSANATRLYKVAETGLWLFEEP